jgi:hypothetical protein
MQEVRSFIGRRINDIYTTPCWKCECSVETSEEIAKLLLPSKPVAFRVFCTRCAVTIGLIDTHELPIVEEGT